MPKLASRSCSDALSGDLAPFGCIPKNIFHLNEATDFDPPSAACTLKTPCNKADIVQSGEYRISIHNSNSVDLKVR